MAVNIKLDGLEDLRIVCEAVEHILKFDLKDNLSFTEKELIKIATKLRNDFENFSDVKRNQV